ncbi:cytochrome P450 [Sporormia fimetaria CBS 119925]|uniref:Cytochrome P450 n=1 Tax=Sporormia fimetaria CBS 119925 TaxID=1340428 RepID=A0A6A6V532_9PLEO|nr:cytochrome P450 [Sporormia fimetaria CBS 119925]
MATSKLLVTAAIAALSVMGYGLRIGYQRRSKVNRLRKQGMAMPPWSWLFGHLKVLQSQLNGAPPDANVYWAMRDLAVEHADTEVFLMDFWPMFTPVLMISDPEMSLQVSNQYNLPKPESQHKSMAPIVGGPSLISMNDTDWKYWRSLLNPGFSASAMADLVPSVVDTVALFCERLRQKVGSPAFRLDDLTMDLSMDVITKVTLDTDLHTQRREHPLAHALRTIIAWHSFWDPRVLLNPLRPLVQWYYGRIMDSLIRAEIAKRFEELKEKLATADPKGTKNKSVISLALNDYVAGRRQKGEVEAKDLKLDDAFSRIAANQIRLFLFAGNDSTSCAIVYAYHLLSRHPDVLADLQAEHDAIFGPVEETASKLKNEPALLNKCKQTLAVIKETLRLYPPAASMREGKLGVSLTDKNGNIYPTDGLEATIMHHSVHRNPRFWPRPEEFLPQRWLVGPGHELYNPPNNGSYRPFELGPRNCIGQTLIYNEIRIVLVMTLRSFRIQPAYDEWDAMQRRSEGVLTKLARKCGLKGEVPKTHRGERAYQTTNTGARPADGYPCTVSALK